MVRKTAFFTRKALHYIIFGVNISENKDLL